jgi:hypothetical protein
LRAHAPSDLGTSDDNGDTASNFSRRCREPVVARYQHWGRLASDFWRCKAVLDDLDVGVLDTLPDDERDRGSVLSVRAACSACERVNVHVRVCVCVCVCVSVCVAHRVQNMLTTHLIPAPSPTLTKLRMDQRPPFVPPSSPKGMCSSLALVSDVCTHVSTRVFAYLCTSY